MGESSSALPRLVRFGVYELDRRSGELRKSGLRIALQEQPRQVLAALLERPGEVVTRDELRQRLWRGDTFVDFEHGLNAAVKRLRETLGDSAESPRFVETLPRRGYRFIAPVELEPARQSAASPPASPDDVREDHPAKESASPPRRSLVPLAVLLAGAFVVAALVWSMMRSRAQLSETRATPVPLTLLTGSELAPSFSPDDTQVAFVWSHAAEENWDIYVKVVGSSGERRLTSHPAPDAQPRWSPDGRWIAYLRGGTGPPIEGRVRLVSPLGESDREISGQPASGLDWTPDGRYVVAAGSRSTTGLRLIAVETGEARALLLPADGEWIGRPAVSPDGRSLAFAACREAVLLSECDVRKVDLREGYTVTGTPQRLTPERVFRLTGITWTADGRYVIYGAQQTPGMTLWRVRSDGRQPPEPIVTAGTSALTPAAGHTGRRLAFSQAFQDDDVYRLDPDGGARPVARSSSFDSNPQLSPDGRRFAFCSMRSGERVEVWMARSDGTGEQQLTHGPGLWQCSPTWSPDGRLIAFDSRTRDGEWHIWTIESESRRLRQVTKGPGKQNMPTWSQDGQWIYFSWDQGSGRDIWRIHTQNGTTQRLTHGGGGIVGRESADGQSVLYQPAMFDGALLAQPFAGGEARVVLPCVKGTAYSVVRSKLYYLPCAFDAGLGPSTPVHEFDPATGVDRQVARLESYAHDNVPSGFAVSPDGRTIYYARTVSRGADLMMIDGF